MNYKEAKTGDLILTREGDEKICKEVIYVEDMDGDEQEVIVFTDNTRSPSTCCRKLNQ